MQKVGDPEQVEPPDRIGSKLPDCERPRLAISQQREPRNADGRIRRVAPDEGQLFRADAWMRCWRPIEGPPDCQPQQAERASGDKGPVPSVVVGDPRDD